MTKSLYNKLKNVNSPQQSWLQRDFFFQNAYMFIIMFPKGTSWKITALSTNHINWSGSVFPFKSCANIARDQIIEWELLLLKSSH